MASKRRIRRKSCRFKTRYGSRAAAEEIMLAIVRAGKKRGGWLHVYPCRFCGGFHFGHAAGSNQREALR